MELDLCPSGLRLENVRFSKSGRDCSFSNDYYNSNICKSNVKIKIIVWLNLVKIAGNFVSAQESPDVFH